jgi:hypothetical protein
MTAGFLASPKVRYASVKEELDDGAEALMLGCPSFVKYFVPLLILGSYRRGKRIFRQSSQLAKNHELREDQQLSTQLRHRVTADNSKRRSSGRAARVIYTAVLRDPEGVLVRLQVGDIGPWFGRGGDVHTALSSQLKSAYN